MQRVSDLASDATLPVIVCGDLNCGPSSDVCVALRTHQLGLRDAYAQPVHFSSQLRGGAHEAAKDGHEGTTTGQSFTTWKFR